MAKSNDAEHTSVNLIGNGTTIKGEVKSNGDIRIDGTLVGQVYSKGKIIVGNTGVIEGEIYCQNADFSGKINAKVEVSELLSLKATSRLNGEIVTCKLAIEPGARFTGSC
ncbi:MAG: bactofilin family protein, partial [Bacteroidota bacterium]